MYIAVDIDVSEALGEATTDDLLNELMERDVYMDKFESSLWEELYAKLSQHRATDALALATRMVEIRLGRIVP